MAAITFHANVLGAGYSTLPSGIPHAAGSGLGFYGNGYGTSVPVGQYQDSTWVTNANGTAVDNYALNNTKYTSISGVSCNGLASIVTSGMPNYLAPLNIRFTHDTPVRTQNCKLRIYDRSNINNQASGVTTQVYEVRHPNGSTNERGLLHRGVLGAHAWTEYQYGDTMTDLVFTSSPGVSGLNTSASDTIPATSNGFTNWTTDQGSAHQNTRHDWYCALSSSPDSIGSKLYALYFTLEYL